MGGALGGVLKLIDVAGWLEGMVLPGAFVLDSFT